MIPVTRCPRCNLPAVRCPGTPPAPCPFGGWLHFVQIERGLDGHDCGPVAACAPAGARDGS